MISQPDWAMRNPKKGFRHVPRVPFHIDGRRDFSVHKFAAKSKPFLSASEGHKAVYLTQHVRFRNPEIAGIVDRKEEAEELSFHAILHDRPAVSNCIRKISNLKN